MNSAFDDFLDMLQRALDNQPYDTPLTVWCPTCKEPTVRQPERLFDLRHGEYIRYSCECGHWVIRPI